MPTVGGVDGEMVGAIWFTGGASRHSGCVSPAVVVTEVMLRPAGVIVLIPVSVANAISVPSGDQAGLVSVWPTSGSVRLAGAVSN